MFKLSQCTIFRVKNELSHFRLGITLKLKVNSVQRNRIKRAVREEFRLLGLSLSGYDYNVLISNKKVIEKEHLARLRKCIELELKKAIEKKK